MSRVGVSSVGVVGAEPSRGFRGSVWGWFLDSFVFAAAGGGGRLGVEGGGGPRQAGGGSARMRARARLPFIPSTVRHRALSAWQAAELAPITLHEARHSTASMLRAAGIDFKLISVIVGHASVTITQDRYTHVSRDHLRDAAARLDAYLERGVGKTRETDAPIHAVESGRER